MQSIRQCIQRSFLIQKFVIQKSNIISDVIPALAVPSCNIYLSCALKGKSPFDKKEEDFRWVRYNEVIYPKQGPDEERRPAFVCHVKPNIKYSPKKMWYVAGFIRGMTIDEAIKQLSFVDMKGAAIVKETLIEAQKMAVEEQNVEYKSNLWVAESFATKGVVIKGMRRHARNRMGVVHYRYCNYFVRLEEGKPPEYYYAAPQSAKELLDNWMKHMHMRKIPQTL